MGSEFGFYVFVGDALISAHGKSRQLHFVPAGYHYFGRLKEPGGIIVDSGVSIG